MSFVKEVPGSDLREGDIIRHQGKPFTIRWLKRNGPHTFKFGDGTRTDYSWDGSRFLLLHRPWSRGTTEAEQLQIVDAAIMNYWLGRVPTGDALKKLEEALTNYWLGLENSDKPLLAPGG